MKAFCHHHRPWFKCGVCEEDRNREIDYVAVSKRDFLVRQLAAIPWLPALGIVPWFTDRSCRRMKD